MAQNKTLMILNCYNFFFLIYKNKVGELNKWRLLRYQEMFLNITVDYANLKKVKMKDFYLLYMILCQINFFNLT